MHHKTTDTSFIDGAVITAAQDLTRPIVAPPSKPGFAHLPKGQVTVLTNDKSVHPILLVCTL